MMTAARSTVHPPPPQPIRRKESTVTAATVNSSVTEGYGKTLTCFSPNIIISNILHYNLIFIKYIIFWLSADIQAFFLINHIC